MSRIRTLIPPSVSPLGNMPLPASEQPAATVSAADRFGLVTKRVLEATPDELNQAQRKWLARRLKQRQS
jgi:hypothetical protein